MPRSRTSNGTPNSSATIGFIATPGKQTVGFFQQNLVMEDTHERAVADRVNVGYEVYRIRTETTTRGGLIEKGFYVDRRSKETRARRLELLDEHTCRNTRSQSRAEFFLTTTQ